MGCIFSKKPLSAPAFSDRSSTSTRVQHLRNNTSNGILRVPKLNLEQEDGDVSDRSQGHVDIHNNVRLLPPPPPPTSSPVEHTPRPEPTNPPTPEHERPSMHVQYAEDLRPASPQKSQMINSKHKHFKTAADDTKTRSRETLDDKNKSSVSVSNVGLKPNINGIRGAPMPNQDLSLEDLDTEIDEYNKIRVPGPTSKINPVTTDILLPRRKGTPPVQTTQQMNINNISENMTKQDCAPASVRKDTPYPGKGLAVTKHELTRKTAEHSTILEKDETTNLNRKDLPSNQAKIVNVSKSKHDSQLLSKMHSSPSAKHEIVEGKETHLHMKDRPGTLSDIHVHTDHDPDIKTVSHSVQVHKTLYEQDLENTRLARKRKRTKNRQADYAPQQSDTVTINVKDNDVVLEGTLKSVKGRPDSGTSVWTMDSKKVFGSTDTLHSVGMDSWGNSVPDNYPHIKAGMTPISFRTFDDDAADIIDLEDNGDLNNDSWLSDDQPAVKEETFDEWYGVKPYKSVSSVGKKDTGVIKDNDIGPSSSELSTKQKLIYSRFARRPQSESLPRMQKKPPLPPGTLRARPVSDTVRKPNYTSSSFFTTDLDIH